MIKSRRTWIAILFTLVFLGLAFRRVDFAEVGSALRSAAYWLLVPAVAIYFAAFWLRALRWRLLLSPLGDVSVGRTYWVATIGYAANNVLPLRLGEILRAYLLRRKPGIRATATLATIAVERVLDGLTLLSWLVPILLFASTAQALPTAFRVTLQGSALMFGGLAIGLVGVVLFPKLALRVLGLLLRPLPARFSTPALSLAEAFASGFAVLRRGRLLVPLALLSQGIWLGESVLYLFVAWALDLPLSFAALGAAVAASNLATSVPSSSGGIGPFELLARESLVLFGVGTSIAATYAILVHATLLIPVTVAGFLLLLIEGVSLKEALRLPNLVVVPKKEEEATG